jgi:signal transduction histidine kinase
VALSLPRSQQHHVLRHGRPAWPSLLAATLCGLAVLHAWLLPSISDPRAPYAIAIQLLQPLAAIGAVSLMLVAAWRHGPGSRRRAWSLHALAILASMAAGLIQIGARAQGTAIVTPLSDTLYMLTYVLALIGTALYLPLRAWWVGSALRILLDSAAVSIAALVLLHSLLPLLLQPWTRSFSAQLNWLALDAGVLLTVGILGLRYGRSGGPLVALMFPSVLCLLIGDIVFLAVSWLPDGELWHFVPGPLYTLHRVFLALGAYRGVTQPPRPPSVSFTVMPMTEWLLWTAIPRVLSLAACTAVMSGVRPPRAPLVALLLVTVAREALAAYEQRRVTLALHAAQQQALVSATQTQEFLARIIHDIAAPVHGLWNATQRLQSDERVVTLLHMQLQHLSRLVEQLRAYQHARHMRGTPPNMEEVDLVPICAAAVDAVQDHADARGIQLRLVFAPEATRVVADVAAVRRVLDNLLSNAITATEAGGEVVIESSLVNDRMVRLEVTDSGCGILVEQQECIFEPLVRLHGAGSGLGLAIVRELVQAMRGEIGVRSQVGCGSSFWIRLPRGER